MAEILSTNITSQTEARTVMGQNDGDVTKAYYAKLNALGPVGQIAVALFRAQKRSGRAKDYRRGKWRRAAYDVKSWSLGELCRLLKIHGADLGIRYGWKEDLGVLFGGDPSWVLYVDLPQGQVSFHSPDRGEGPDYEGEWDGARGTSLDRILSFCELCEQVGGEAREAVRS